MRLLGAKTLNGSGQLGPPRLRELCSGSEEGRAWAAHGRLAVAAAKLRRSLGGGRGAGGQGAGHQGARGMPLHPGEERAPLSGG